MHILPLTSLLSDCFLLPSAHLQPSKLPQLPSLASLALLGTGRQQQTASRTLLTGVAEEYWGGEWRRRRVEGGKSKGQQQPWSLDSKVEEEGERATLVAVVVLARSRTTLACQCGCTQTEGKSRRTLKQRQTLKLQQQQSLLSQLQQQHC